MDKYYKILGLKEGASKADIKKAYRTLAMKYHPDKNQGDATAEEKFKEINNAYKMLTDSAFAKQRQNNHPGWGNTEDNETTRGYRRTSDNESRRTGFGGGFGGADFKSMYDDLFAKRQQHYNKGFTENDMPSGGGEDITVDFKFGIKQLLTGVKISSKINRKIVCRKCYGRQKVCSKCGGHYMNKQTCKNCNGTGIEQCKSCNGTGAHTLSKDITIDMNIRKMHVKISESDDKKYFIMLRFPGMGHQHTENSYVSGREDTRIISGDLFFRIAVDSVPPNIHFDYNGNIRHDLNVSLRDFIRGRVAFTSLTGIEYDIDTRRINPDRETKLSIEGAGIMKNTDGQIGDYSFHTKVKMPDWSKLNADDKETMLKILEKL